MCLCNDCALAPACTRAYPECVAPTPDDLSIRNQETGSGCASLRALEKRVARLEQERDRYKGK